MANNRMFLVNRRTRQWFSFAKYYPATGWYLNVDEKVFQKYMDADDEPEPTDWELVYESDDTFDWKAFREGTTR